MENPPSQFEDSSALVHATAQGLAANALVNAAGFLLQGERALLERANDELDLAVDGFAGVGAVYEHSITMLVKRVLPRLASRSTWNLLGQIHSGNATWERYLILLARGLGPRIDENSSIVELWPSQITAIGSGLLESTASTMVRMPTSAGKTRIAELAIVDHLVSNPNSRCVYIAPFRALAGELEGALSSLFSDLGYRLSTTMGSFETDEAEQNLLFLSDVVISTPEKLDLVVRLNREFLDSVGLIVIDEGQLLEDASRGSDFELLLARIRVAWPTIRFVSLSAVVPESTLRMLASWLAPSDARFSVSDWRPAIQRLSQFSWQGERGFIRFLPETNSSSLDGFLPSVIQTRTYEYINQKTGRRNRKRFPDPLVKAQTAAELAYVMAPAGAVLVFCPTPSLAESVSDALLKRIELTELANEHVLSEFGERDTSSVQVCSDWLGPDHPLSGKLRRGIAVHHGKMPDAIKSAVEQDFRERRYQVIVATSTLAQGVNLPIKTVIMHSTSRHDGKVSTPISAREYWNIAGRAGRAGEETEGLIIHVCQNPNDFGAVRWYAERRSDLESLQSALLADLRRLVEGRITDLSYFQHLDSELLALLVEEDVDEVTEEWVEEIFRDTLAFVEARERALDIQSLQTALQRLLENVSTQVPDKELRRSFFATGLSLQSCQAFRDHIAANRSILESLLTESTVEDIRALAEYFLEASFLSDELRTNEEPLFEIAELTERWLLGEDFSAIRERLVAPEVQVESMSRFVEETLAYRLPWGISSYLRLALRELDLDWSSISPIVRNFASMVKYGVPTPPAVWAMNAGISFRSSAIQLAQIFIADAHEISLAAFLQWFGRLRFDELVDRIGLQGAALENAASAVQRTSPSTLARRAANSTQPVFPLTDKIVVRGRRARLLGAELRGGEDVRLRRDYDMAFDRNAVVCVYGRSVLGSIGRNAAQYLAPMIDAGTAYIGSIVAIEERDFATELTVEIVPATAAPVE